MQRSGWDVASAGTLDEARRLLADRHFHLVVLDVRLPDGSGLDLLREIRETSPITEVVMLTAYGTVQEAIRAMKDGAHDFLTKPCKLGELEAVLEKAAREAVAGVAATPPSSVMSSASARACTSSASRRRFARCST